MSITTRDDDKMKPIALLDKTEERYALFIEKKFFTNNFSAT